LIRIKTGSRNNKAAEQLQQRTDKNQLRYCDTLKRIILQNEYECAVSIHTNLIVVVVITDQDLVRNCYNKDKTYSQFML